MKIFSISLFLFFTIVFSYSIIAQDVGSVQKTVNFSTPEKIQESLGDPLPGGNYSIGSGGYFPTIDSAFNKLSIDGISGEVTLELIDNLYTAPTETFGFLLIGPIVGAGENSRVIIKPAQNHQVTIEGNGGSVLFFSNTSYVTLDGVTLTGPTSLQINSFYNSQFTWNDGVDFLDDSDHNVVTNINFNDEDVARPSTAIGFWTNSSGAIGAPDNNLIENNNIVQGAFAIYVSASWSNVYGFNNIIRENLISASTGNIISWGIQLEKNENTIIENNVVSNIINSVANLELALGINAHWCNSCTIRNNVVHSVSSNVRNGSTGILLSGTAGNEGYDNIIYNNMIFDIQSTSANTLSRVTGIQIWHNHNPKVYYNSIHLSGTGSNYLGSGALFVRTNTSDIEAYDNIFVNTRDESLYCATSIYLYTNPTILTSDYNDLCYQPSQNSCLVRAAGGDYLNLEEWQATGHDIQSISEMPNFLALDDLHIDESISTNLESGATPIAGIDTDFDGDLRNATTPDIGADEFDGIITDTLYVPGDYTTIQEAIVAAINGNTILVANGTYYENINYRGKAITVASHFLVDGDSTHIENTIIDGSQPSHSDTGSVVTFNSGEDTTSILCGFTITGGTGTYLYLATPIRKYGGGICAINSGMKVKNNIIEFNVLDNTDDLLAEGGGIGVGASDSVDCIIEGNVIRNNSINSASTTYVCQGGGLRTNAYGNIWIINNKVCDNTVTGRWAYDGGVSFNDFATGLANKWIVSNVISGNEVSGTVQSGGGGTSIYETSVNLKNNLIVNNSAEYGGGLWIETTSEELTLSGRAGITTSSRSVRQKFKTSGRSTSNIENNTIVDNTADEYGGGLYILGVLPHLMNCVLWGNEARVQPQVHGSADIQYSDIEGGYAGEGNIDEDPQFILNNEYCLLEVSSPCIDAGNPDPMYFDVGAGGNALPPAQGSVINDIGHLGGPSSLWYLWSWPMPVEDETIILSDYLLMQNYPNPFNPSTKIKYSVPYLSNVVIKVFDILGREIETLVNEEKPIGSYNVEFNAINLSSGIYFYRLQAGSFVETKKMVLMK